MMNAEKPYCGPPPEGLPPRPAVSKKTMFMAGLLVDVYGLEELARGGGARRVSCLWALHGRLGGRANMEDFAARAVTAWLQQAQARGAGPGLDARRGLVVLAPDQRNHVSRLVDESRNGAWGSGNPFHGIDMLASVVGMASDVRALMDFAGAYLFPEAESRPVVDDHLVMGFSLGGHCAWQLAFGEERVRAAAIVVGCADYMALMKDRARGSKLTTYDAADAGASFFGSRDFPPDCIAACLKHDPKALLFGTDPVARGSEGASMAQMERLRRVLDERVRGKRFLVCSGAEDRLVPHAYSAPFLDFMADATRTWYKDGGVYWEEKVYEGVGHAFGLAMLKDTLRFVVDCVARADGGEAGGRHKM